MVGAGLKARRWLARARMQFAMKGAALDRFPDLILNLVAAGIGFLIATVRRWTSQALRLRRARRFWRPFVDGDLHLVLAVFDDSQHIEWERSGLAGVGDVMALTELQRYLEEFRIDDHGLEYGHTISGQRLGDNLVLIGGADSNRVTRQVMNRLPLTIVYNDPDANDVAFLDRTDGSVMRPATDERGKILTDQGVVIRAKNPFNRDNNVLIVAGSYGFGSVAAVRLTASRRFLTESIVRSGDDFEAFFTTDIVESSPQEPSLRILRLLV